MSKLAAIIERYNSLDVRVRQGVGIGVAALMVLVVFLSFANERINALVQKRASRENDLLQMMALKQRYYAARAASLSFGNRLAAQTPDDSPSRVIEEAGIKGKASQITPLKGEVRGQYVEDAAEVKLEGLSANEAVNLLYRLERGTRPVIIKSAAIKTRFDDPAKLDVTIILALLKNAPAGQR